MGYLAKKLGIPIIAQCVAEASGLERQTLDVLLDADRPGL